MDGIHVNLSVNIVLTLSRHTINHVILLLDLIQQFHEHDRIKYTTKYVGVNGNGDGYRIIWLITN